MSNPFMTKQQEAGIIKMCKEYAGQGTDIRVTDAIEQVRGTVQGGSILKQIAKKITRDDQFIAVPYNNADFVIPKNLDYKPKAWHERNPVWYALFLIVVTAAFS